MNPNQKILIISWGVYPLQTATSIIVHNLAKEIGSERVVVIGEKNLVEKDWDKVDYPLYHIDALFGLKKGRDRLKWLKYLIVLNKINRVIKKHKCTHILCPFPDEFYLSLAYLASKSNSIPLYPWMHNTYLDNAEGMRKKIANFIQSRVFSHAEIIFTISEGLTEYYNRNYKDNKFDTLVHCFTIPDPKKIVFYKPDKIKLALSGNFNESCSDAILRACRVILKKENCELHVFGNQIKNELINNRIDTSNIVFYGFMAEDEFNDALNNCDVMLLPHGFEGQWSKIEYETIFPTRTIPLLYSGKPILLHSPAWASLNSFFKKHRCGFIVEEANEKELEHAIDNIFSNSQIYETIIANALNAAKIFDVKNVKESLYDKIYARENMNFQ